MSEEETSYTCSSLLRLWMTLSASGTDQDELKQTEASLERKEKTSKTRNTVEMKLKVLLSSASDLGMFLPKCTLLVLLWWLFTPLKSLSVCCSRCPHSSLTSVCCHLLLTDYFYKKIRIKSSARAVTASQLIIWLYCHKRIVGGVITHTHTCPWHAAFSLFLPSWTDWSLLVEMWETAMCFLSINLRLITEHTLQL